MIDNMDNLRLSRLQQCILKKGNNYLIRKELLIDNGFANQFLEEAISNGYLKETKKHELTATEKLIYMPVTIARAKLDHKDDANKFNRNDPDFLQATLRAATEYHAATIVLLERFSINFEGEKIPLFTPALVYAAFASELYIKAQLLHEGNYEKGHFLKDLFHKLQLTSQSDALAYFLHNGYSEEAFSRELDFASEAFPETRFHHERSGFMLNAYFLLKFCTALHSLTKNLK